MQRHCLRAEFSALWSKMPVPRKTRRAVEAVLALAA